MLIKKINLAEYVKAGSASAINKQTLLSNILDKSYNKNASCKTMCKKNDAEKVKEEILTLRYGKRILAAVAYDKKNDGDFATFRSAVIEKIKNDEEVQDAAWDMYTTLSKMNTDNAAKSKEAA